MPEIAIKHIVSFSTEDKNYQAQNLVKSEGYKKWKTLKGGEKNASVTLQFEKATQIHQIDIGNEFSAFIEVLVGKSGMPDDEFQVLLVASSFMNPMESRGSQNGSRVRIFTSDQLSQTARELKWDRVKLVCTQPFNKTTQYGLSFVKFHSPPEAGDKTLVSPKKQMTLGAFAVKSDSGSDHDISAGSLFAHRKKEPVPLTGAAAVRAASKLAQDATISATPKREEKPSTNKTPSSKRRHSNEDDSTPQHHSKHKVQPTSTTASSSSKPVPLKKQSTSLSSVASSTASSRDSAPPLKRTKTEPPRQSKEKEFRRLMEKVTFVMSGFQHPFRGELRDKAVEMGAVYKPDWTKSCTHLICAFDNTPKYKEVKGKGKIVKKEWLLDCHKSKKLLPWRKYRLGRAKTPEGNSDESSDGEYIPTPKKAAEHKKGSPKGKTSTEKAATSYQDGSTTDVDTEDELERIKHSKEKSPKERKTSQKSPPKQKTDKATNKTESHHNKSDDDDIYNQSTDEEMGNGVSAITSNGNTNSDEITDLVDIFSAKSFFLYGKFSPSDQRLLTRFIIAYDGEVKEYMNEKVNFVITDSEWDENFDTAISDNPGLTFVKSKWILACHDQQKLTPYQKYVIVPN